ncbi:hypothetical protein [Bartonella krasnovii]|uniref:Uncharacterized protein n=1 Tax=Bartonella krasnovii TaxID=2267275 RepID=A0ABY3VY59_9HYPH|nr:hypothetical protein [Bartonella krasnovii]UNF28944.1 hypothetical protein MNL13_07025 [Bartonella krasnovii]UNF35307.1 hypothetical protein MNL12_06980 [Bartonella krasnovii]UNF36937.1 hypothetical protein MNL11_07660 [Bartonella krasnovii]UNF38624.1 hypothetical protein MNL10_07860 [Bartonella krasnovii]UNF40353.1 hypothetical protein MNL09_07970 [Bartonella krasnovii]
MKTRYYNVWALGFGVGCGDMGILSFVLKMVTYGGFSFYHLLKYVSYRFIDVL